MLNYFFKELSVSPTYSDDSIISPVDKIYISGYLPIFAYNAKYYYANIRNHGYRHFVLY